MALSRQLKGEIVESYVERLGRSQAAIWANYSGLKVDEFQELRRQVREASAETMVVKNTLMRIALDRAGLPYDEKVMTGPSAVTFLYGEPAPATRAIVNFGRANEQSFQIRGGLVGGKVVDEGAVRELVNIPSRDVLLSRVVGGIDAPLSGLVFTLSALLRGMVTVLDGRRQQLEGADQ